MTVIGERMRSFGQALGMGLHAGHLETLPPGQGNVHILLVEEESGIILHDEWRKNVVTRDASILTARLYKDNQEPNRGAYMLAIGTGASGALLSPDAADPRQRKLNAEIERKAFVSTTFRDTDGVAVSIPTNIVDFTTTFAASEAVGPLNEMGLISPISDNPAVTNPNPQSFPDYDPTIDITTYDVLINYLTFPVISKPNTATLTITWRFTF